MTKVEFDFGIFQEKYFAKMELNGTNREQGIDKKLHFFTDHIVIICNVPHLSFAKKILEHSISELGPLRLPSVCVFVRLCVCGNFAQIPNCLNGSKTRRGKPR